MYDVGVPMPIMSTYVPIDFRNLYLIGAHQQEAVNKAADQLNTAIQKFGEFRSPSNIDTENWYKLTLGNPVISGIINEAVNNPDALKDTSWRSRLNAGLMGLDYSSMSMLKESADNLRAGLEMRAKMAAENRYKASWDTANIPNYDTLGSNKVFDQITPIRYMTANELSNSYFDNLKPSSLGSVYKDGVKYDRTGITYDTLYDISDARFNDLVSTPQGQQYYREALEANGGNPEAAKQAFIGMIADSQRDRIINQDTVNPLWLLQAKANYANKTQIIRPNPTRLDFLNTTIGETVVPKLESAQADFAKENPAIMDSISAEYKQAAIAAQAAAMQYKKTGSDADFVNATKAANKVSSIQSGLYSELTKYVMGKEFERVAGFSPKEEQSGENFNTKTYWKGVNAALKKVSAPIGLMKDDALLSRLGGWYTEVTDANGMKHAAYQFDTSSGFILPETVFNLMTGGTYPDRKTERYAGLFRDSDFPFRELVESGSIGGVQFLPAHEDGTIKVGPGDIALSGKLRIPKESIEHALGTGMVSGAVTTMLLPFGRSSTKSALKHNFGASDVKEVVGKDGIEYYEIDAYKLLPNSQSGDEYWHAVNQIWQGGSQAGIGGASQAKEEYPTSAQQLLGD